MLRHVCLLSVLVAPALAQPDPATVSPGMRGLDRLHVVLQTGGEAGTRAACGLTPALEAALFEVVRRTLAAANIDSPPGVERRSLPDDFGAVLTTAGYDRDRPKLIVGVSVVRGEPGPSGACVTNTTAVLTVPVSAQVAPTGVRFEGNFTLWNHFRLNRSQAEGAPRRLSEIVAREAELVVEAWRAANAGPAPRSVGPRDESEPAPPTTKSPQASRDR